MQSDQTELLVNIKVDKEAWSNPKVFSSKIRKIQLPKEVVDMLLNQFTVYKKVLPKQEYELILRQAIASAYFEKERFLFAKQLLEHYFERGKETVFYMLYTQMIEEFKNYPFMVKQLEWIEIKQNEGIGVSIMKKSIEIIGLPIINISAGVEIGNVKSLIVNPENGTVDFLTIEHEDYQESVKAIPFSKVVGIGGFAVTIESDYSIIDLNEIPIANQLVKNHIKIFETRVMTRKGQLLGEAIEYFINEDNGVIIGLQLSTKDKNVIVKADLVLTFGKDILVVKDEATTAFLDSEEKLLDTLEQKKSAGKIKKLQNHQVGDFNQKQIEEINAKQIELLEGKTVIKDIYSDSRLLISKNTVLTKDDIIKAQQEGPSAFIELSMNTEF